MAEVPPGGASSMSAEVVVMDVLFDRVAGIDVGKATVTVCVRTPGTVASGRR